MVNVTTESPPPAPTGIADLIRGEFAELKTSFKAELLEHIADIIKLLSDYLEVLTAY